MDHGTSREPDKERRRIDDVPHALNLIGIPPLKNAALIQVVACLWQLPSLDALYDFYKAIDRELLSSDERSPCRRFASCFHAAKLQVQERFSLLELPDNLKSEASSIVEPVGYRILHWLKFETCVSPSPKFIDSICWTAVGTVHGVNTIEKLLAKHNPGTIVDQFRTAAYCCAEKLVVDLWHKIPEETKRDLAACRMHDYYDDHLLAYWIFFCKGHLSELLPVILSEDQHLQLYDRNHSVDRNMCRLTASTGNLSGTEYFWAKLTDEERDSDMEMLMMSVPLNKRYSRLRNRRREPRAVSLCRPLLNDRVFQERYCHQMGDNTTSSVAISCLLVSNVKNPQRLENIMEMHGNFILYLLCRTWPFYRFVVPLISFAGHKFPDLTYVHLMDALRVFIPPDVADDILHQLWGYFPQSVRKPVIDCAVRLSIYESESTRIRDVLHPQKPIRQLIEELKEGRLQTGLGLGISSEEDYNELVERGHPKLISIIETEELRSAVRAQNDSFRALVNTMPEYFEFAVQPTAPPFY